MLLTLSVKIITYPATKKQIESGLAMQNLQPQIKALKERWPGTENQQRLNAELQARARAAVPATPPPVRERR